MPTRHANIEAPADDAKRAAILAAAESVFLAYGFQRVTMDDIARAADMSRPALYLVFRNKAAIYRALAKAYLDASLGQAEAALAGPEPFEDRLVGAIERSVFALVAKVRDTPHGEELFDLKNDLAADLHAEWHDRMLGALAGVIADEARRLGVDLAGRGLSAPTLAAVFLAGLEGLKAHVPEPAAMSAAFRQLVRMTVLAIAPGETGAGIDK